MIGFRFREARTDRDGVRLVADLVLEQTRAQRGEHRHVTGEHAELACDRGHLDRVRFGLELEPGGGDDFEFE